jgi:hypothetical protein
VGQLVTYHYLEAEFFRFSAITSEQCWQLSKRQQADVIWQALFVDNSPISEATRGVVAVLKEFGLPTNNRDLSEVRALTANLGPLLPENVDSKAYPPREHAIGSIRIIGYDPLDTMVLPEVAGLRTWAGEDLTIDPNFAAGKVYVRGQK